MVYTDLHARVQRWARRVSHTASVLQAEALLSPGDADPCELDNTTFTSANTKETPPSTLLGFLGDVFHAGGDFLGRSFVLTLLLAIGLPGLVLLLLVVDIARQPVAQAPVAATPAPVAVAEITRSHRTIWNMGDVRASLPVGTPLIAGRTLTLEEGLAELTFIDGARVVLKAPARFEVSDRGRGFLHEGSLAATVPPPARGFTVQTPLAVVVDLGTEFGVSVTNDGVEETHVFAGLVKAGVKPPSGMPLSTERFEKLRIGEARRMHLVKGTNAVQTDAIKSAPSQFIRRVPPESNVGLPEPTIMFSHRADSDPTTEGWALVRNEGRGGEMKACIAAPTADQNTPAWSIDDRSARESTKYEANKAAGLTPELLAEADAKGWVMRTRAKVTGEAGARQGLCFCTFWGPERDWCIRPLVDRDGNQCVLLLGQSSLGSDATVTIPNSADRYIDCEVRYDPRTKDADVYVDGRLVATGYFRGRTGASGIMSLHFGTFLEMKCHASFARVEWGILGH